MAREKNLSESGEISEKRRMEGKIEDRSEKSMRFSERSRICLIPRRGKDKSKIALFSFLTGPDRRSGPVRNEKRAITDLPNSPKARPRESIHEICVAGGLNKGAERPNSSNLDVRLLPKKLEIIC